MKKLIFTFSLILFASLLFSQSIPKMSSWDGVALAIKNYYEENANDPESIKYSEASLMMKLNNGMFAQRVKLRGKNAYGATMLNERYFIISGTGTTAKVTAVYDETEFVAYTINNSIKILQKYNTDGTIVN